MAAKANRQRHEKLEPGRMSRDGRCMVVALEPGTTTRRGKCWIICADCGEITLQWRTSLYRSGSYTCCGCVSLPLRNKEDAIRKMVRDGKSLYAMSRELGVRASSIRAAAKKRGIKLGPRTGRRGQRWPSGITVAMRREAVQLANETSARYAAEYFGVTERSVVRWRSGRIRRMAMAASAKIETRMQ